MQAVQCTEFGPPERLILADLPPLAPGPGQVKIEVKAAGLNFPDTLLVAGKYQSKPKLPFTPGMECSGRIAGVGAGVKGLPIGQRVMAFTNVGAMAEEVLTDAGQVFPLSESMDFIQAAAFPVTYGTAYHGLHDRAKLKAGETLLVLGAAGGVGLNAVELGRVMGARVIAAASSAPKLELARSYGAAALIDYATEPLRERIKALTEGRDADVIFDPVGGDAFDQSLRGLARHGRYLVVGFASGRIPQAPVNILLLKEADLLGVAWGGFALREPEKNRENFARMLQWFAEGKLKPHVSRTFPLAQVAEAMNFLLSRQSTGKIVLTVAEG
jgi:NADPH2:quinone reductase